MESVKQTAVEWLHEIAKQREPDKFDWQQAKEMEKEQIVNAYRDGRSDQQSEKLSRFYNRMAEQYYNEQYGK